MIRSRIIYLAFFLLAFPAFADHSALDCSDSYTTLRVHEEENQGVKVPRLVTLSGKKIEDLGLSEKIGEEKSIVTEQTAMTSVSHFLVEDTLADAAGKKATWHLICTRVFGF